MQTSMTIFAVPDAHDAAQVQILPMPYDATTSYRSGAALGPKAIEAASCQVDLLDADVGSPHEAGFHLHPISPDVTMRNQVAKAAVKRIRAMRDKGIPEIQSDLAFVNESWHKNNAYTHNWATQVLAKGQLPVLIGGDHSTPFGNIKACAESISEGIGVLHLDAHSDLRESYEGFEGSHASIMHNVVQHIPNVTRLVQVGIRDFCQEEMDFAQTHNPRVVVYYDKILRHSRLNGRFLEKVKEIVSHLPSTVYLSFDIDGLDPTLCPSTGTPVPGGFTWDEVIVLLQAVVDSGKKIIGLDLNEVAITANCPEEVIGEQWDANVGARLLYKMIGFALMSQGFPPCQAPKLSEDLI